MFGTEKKSTHNGLVFIDGEMGVVEEVEDALKVSIVSDVLKVVVGIVLPMLLHILESHIHISVPILGLQPLVILFRLFPLGDAEGIVVGDFVNVPFIQGTENRLEVNLALPPRTIDVLNKTRVVSVGGVHNAAPIGELLPHIVAEIGLDVVLLGDDADVLDGHRPILEFVSHLVNTPENNGVFFSCPKDGFLPLNNDIVVLGSRKVVLHGLTEITSGFHKVMFFLHNDSYLLVTDIHIATIVPKAFYISRRAMIWRISSLENSAQLVRSSCICPYSSVKLVITITSPSSSLP